MIYTPTSLPDAYLIDLEPVEDERGHFARTMCGFEFPANGLVGEYVQTGQSYNRRRGTLRGMHFQHSPHAETKLVRCVQGAIYDVIVDLRPESPTYLRWEGFELSLANGRALYVPEGFAHGFITLADETYVHYQISHPYTPGAAAGIRYDDPALGIVWPEPVTVISAGDQSWAQIEPLRPLLVESTHRPIEFDRSGPFRLVAGERGEPCPSPIAPPADQKRRFDPDRSQSN